jgi:hypothetical protein
MDWSNYQEYDYTWGPTGAYEEGYYEYGDEQYGYGPNYEQFFDQYVGEEEITQMYGCCSVNFNELMITLDHKLEPMDPFVPAPLASVNFDSLTWFLNAEGEVFSDEEGLDHNNVDWDSLRTFFIFRFEFISRIIKPDFRGFKTLPNPKFFQVICMIRNRSRTR